MRHYWIIIGPGGRYELWSREHHPADVGLDIIIADKLEGRFANEAGAQREYRRITAGQEKR